MSNSDLDHIHKQYKNTYSEGSHLTFQKKQTVHLSSYHIHPSREISMTTPMN